ncbi:uncharacterized protein PGTG_22286 [Puccinia graminis f. sp. tritici CRL 75-36-700-3]|uniref:Uncharacterized protein n=1 Tax=Puccinia graminis f. sp. tritici (strain CRL 75-36-700-3 / race SCCL) TaxID=418459 RepID=H6QUA1_PUCGT|nr:uncharacterized protein PGTG_22286 [Puccinia graminis f. sp. tritici CRL 75-36-700-3]EHS64564.1 hypothetical protein PGTG_22286 [Puccinia graminis f. sp. tritici CRL 75-36-700-3]
MPTVTLGQTAGPAPVFRRFAGGGPSGGGLFRKRQRDGHLGIERARRCIAQEVPPPGRSGEPLVALRRPEGGPFGDGCGSAPLPCQRDFVKLEEDPDEIHTGDQEVHKNKKVIS